MNAHETKKGLVFEQLNCAFAHNKFYICTLSVSLIFYFFYDFFLSFEFVWQNYLCQINQSIN